MSRRNAIGRGLLGFGAVVVAACTEEPTDLHAILDRVDGSVGHVDDSGSYSPVTPRIEAPAALPCANGWFEVEQAGERVCAPWAAGAPATCADTSEQHFPGRASCEPIGRACAAGSSYAADLPPSGVLYVAPGAAGGVGTREAPFGRITDAVATARGGEIVALAKGVFEEQVTLDRDVRIVGACVDETTLRAPGELADRTDAVVIPAGVAGAVENLRIEAPGRGIVVGGGGAATATVDGVLLYETRGLLVREGSSATANELVTRARYFPIALPEATDDRAVSVTGGSTLTLTSSVVETRRLWGLLDGIRVTGAGSRLRAEDVATYRTTAQALIVADGGAAELERVALVSPRNAGIELKGGGSSVVATQLAVLEVRAASDGGVRGRAIDVSDHATMTLSRSFITDVRDSAIYVHGADATLRATDVVVAGARGSELRNYFGGYGVFVDGGARVEFERVRFARMRDIGIALLDGTVVGRHLAVVETLERDCSRSACEGFAAGTGVGIYGGAELDVEDFEVVGSALAGVQFAATAHPSISRGRSADNRIGLNLQSNAIDVASFELLLENNARDIDAIVMPTPEAPAAIQ